MAERSHVFIRRGEPSCSGVRGGTQTAPPIHENEHSPATAQRPEGRQSTLGPGAHACRGKRGTPAALPESSLGTGRAPPPWDAIILPGRKGGLNDFRKILPEKAVVSGQLGFIRSPPWVWVPKRGSLLQKLQTQLPEIKQNALGCSDFGTIWLKIAQSGF